MTAVPQGLVGKKIKWVEGPGEPGKTDGNRVTIIDQLKLAPGVWAEIGRYNTRNTAAATQQRLKREAGKDENGNPRLEAVVRVISPTGKRRFAVRAVWLEGVPMEARTWTS